MNHSEFMSILKKQIYSQEEKQQLELAIIICKKLFFNYQKFSEAYNWGNPDLLIDGINLCEKALQRPIDLGVVKTLLSEIDLVIPDMDDFGDYLGSYALNASASVAETLEFLTDHNKEHIYNIATYYTYTIDFQIQEDDELTGTQIDNHPLMIEARNFLVEATK